jgi:hypothetical protein
MTFCATTVTYKDATTVSYKDATTETDEHATTTTYKDATTETDEDATKGEEEDEYAVEKILNKRKRNGIVEYLKWEGYPNKENTWVREEDLSCPQLISEYEIIGQKKKKQVVHINRLKKAYNQNLWKPEKEKKAAKKLLETPVDYITEEELPTRSFPLASTSHDVFPNQIQLDTSPAQLPTDSPSTDHSDPTYHPPEMSRSKRELQITRNEPPITRSRTRILSQDNTD